MSRRAADVAEPGRDSADLIATFLLLRLSLATALFTSIADRFHLLGTWLGERVPDLEVLLTWWDSRLPVHPLIVGVWAFSIVEAMVGAALLLGLLTRLSSLAAGFLLLCTTMVVLFEPKTSLTYSLPAAAAGSFLLALLPAKAGRWSLDAVLGLHEVGSGRSAGRLVRLGAVTGLSLLALLVVSMIANILSTIHVIEI
jgi:uncharacterized membrane protein YphA (DoxX/SURF4 family)